MQNPMCFLKHLSVNLKIERLEKQIVLKCFRSMKTKGTKLKQDSQNRIVNIGLN